MKVTADGGGRDGWLLTLMRCDWMRAYSRSVHLLLVLIAGVYSHCISLISIGTEQIPYIDGYKRNVLISGVLKHSGKMCYNSITGGHINFVLGG